MGIITNIFIAIAIIGSVSSAPVDDFTVKPPGVSLSTTTATATPEQHLLAESKRHAPSNDDSKESKESAESSEEKKRPARDSESSGVIAHQAKDLPQGSGTTSSPVTKDTPQLPARESRDTYEHAAIPAVIPIEQGLSTSSTPASSTSARS